MPGQKEERRKSRSRSEAKRNVPPPVPTIRVKASLAAQKVAQISELVSEILKYLPNKNIDSLTNVNSVWRKEAQKILVKRLPMKFPSGSQLLTQMEKYIAKMGNDCHRSVHFGKLANSQSRAAVREFGLKYGNQIKELSLILGHQSWALDLDILSSFPHLQDLTLNVTRDNDDENLDIQQNIILLKDLKTLDVFPDPKISMSEFSETVFTGLGKSVLSICPSMDNLGLDYQGQEPFLTLFQLPDTSRMLSGLTIIGVNDVKGYKPPLTPLTQLPWQLTTLDIDLFDLGVRQSTLVRPAWIPWLEGVLSRFVPSLKTLSIHRIISHPHFNIGEKKNVKFPKMPNLEILRITHHMDHNVETTDRGTTQAPLRINFVIEKSKPRHNESRELFPSLKELAIQQVGVDGVAMDILNKNGRASLDILDMFFPNKSSSCESLKHIDVDFASSESNRNSCSCGRFCFCYLRGTAFNLLEKMETLFPNAVELENYREFKRRQNT